MIKKAKGYCPSHITSFFTIDEQSDDILLKGSLGAGFCISKGTTTTIFLDKKIKSTEFYINGEKKNDCIVSIKIIDIWISILKERNIDFSFISHLKICHKIEMPLESGFGTSASGALSLLFALNKMSNTNFSCSQLAMLAHKAEILSKSGLGTVAGCYLGGFEYRASAGAPLCANIFKVQYPTNLKVAIFYFGKINTPLALSDKTTKENITQNGQIAITQFNSCPTFENLVDLSHLFSKNSMLLTDKLQELFIELTNLNLKPAMLFFGKGLYFFYQSKYEKKIKKSIKNISILKYSKEVKRFFLSIDKKGARYGF